MTTVQKITIEEFSPKFKLFVDTYASPSKRPENIHELAAEIINSTDWPSIAACERWPKIDVLMQEAVKQVELWLSDNTDVPFFRTYQLIGKPHENLNLIIEINGSCGLRVAKIAAHKELYPELSL